MWYYLIFQTIVLSIACAFIVAGEYQSNAYIVKRKHDLYNGIGAAIILIFLAGLAATFVFYMMPNL